MTALESWETVYSSPEKFGLRVVGEVEFSSGYDFDTTVVWQDVETGRLFYAADSGCSCPSPFENIKTRADLTPLTDAHQFRGHLFRRATNSSYCGDATGDAANRLYQTVSDILKENK